MFERRHFLQSLLGAGLPSSLFAQRQRPPNILFIFSDDHAYQAISCYDKRFIHTPHIDRIAQEGMRFDNCCVTNSICAPSRATILTGKYSHLNGVIDNQVEFDGTQQTFPKLFQQAGYQTALFGKWHLRSKPTGFDAWEVLPGQGSYYNPDFITPQGNKRRNGYCTDVVTDLSLEWLSKGRDPSRPFLLMCQHKAPHRNWMPGPDHLTRFEDVTFPEPPNLFDDYEHRASPAHNSEMQIDRHMSLSSDLKLYPPPEGDKAAGGFLNEYKRMSEAQRRIWDAVYKKRLQEFQARKPAGKDLVRWKYQAYMKDYLRCVASVDDSVGRLLRYLDAEDLASNTLVVYSSDQGFYLGEHGWFDKRWIYEESIRTPLLIRWPGVIQPGSVSKALVSNLDFAETFLDAAGLAVPPDMQGRSMLPILRGQIPGDWRTVFYYHYYEEKVHNVAPHDGVRTNRYTLAHFYKTNEWELFDRQTDPHQMRSVWGKPEYAAVQRQLVGELERLRRELKVPPEHLR
ncbi:MAG: sulfatase [Bryobacteraceae bacterium]|nr:sulfatase [Bryobacteraceae bacterium]MDW8378231.1 sulfatase [Bryobacterales bacterium]